MVATQGLTKHFPSPEGTVRAVEDVTLEARPGEVLGLLGVNGAGKTTLLRMLSTVLTPTRGTARVADLDVAADPARVRASIGFLSSTTALYGRLTGRETLAYFGGLYGLDGPRLRERVDAVADRLALAPFLDRLCDTMSTGQKQRVSIARALLHDPPVLFLDEPTSGLDVVTSQSVLGFVEQARGEGKTVVYCTHIMSEAERLCDRVVVISGGGVRGEGTVASLKETTHAPTLERAFLRLVGAEEGLS